MNSNVKQNTAALASLAQSPQMLNAPTVVPVASGVPTVRKVANTDPYFSIEVDTTGLTESAEIILFDGSQGYQFGFNAAMPLGAVIKGRTATYQFILNDIVHNSSYIDMVRLQVYAPNSGSGGNCCNGGDIAMIQFANAVDVYDSSKGARPRRIDTMYPDMGIHEGQFHKNISSFRFPLTITNRTALVYVQEPGIRVVWSFYQKAEIGRHQ